MSTYHKLFLSKITMSSAMELLNHIIELSALPHF
jgi:hypothetical protein